MHVCVYIVTIFQKNIGPSLAYQHANSREYWQDKNLSHGFLFSFHIYTCITPSAVSEVSTCERRHGTHLSPCVHTRPVAMTRATHSSYIRNPVCVCTHRFMYIYACMYTYVYVYIYIYKYIYIYMNIHINMYVHKYVDRNTYLYVHKYIHIIYIYIHTGM